MTNSCTICDDTGMDKRPAHPQAPALKLMLCGQLLCSYCSHVLIDFNLGEFVEKRADESKPYFVSIPKPIPCPECGRA
jgi:hypothetical protein